MPAILIFTSPDTRDGIHTHTHTQIESNIKISRRTGECRKPLSKCRQEKRGTCRTALSAFLWCTSSRESLDRRWPCSRCPPTHFMNHKPQAVAQKQAPSATNSSSGDVKQKKTCHTHTHAHFVTVIKRTQPTVDRRQAGTDQNDSSGHNYKIVMEARRFLKGNGTGHIVSHPLFPWSHCSIPGRHYL